MADGQWHAHLTSFGDVQPPHGPFETEEEAREDIRVMRGLFQAAVGAELLESEEAAGNVVLTVSSPEGEHSPA